MQFYYVYDASGKVQFGTPRRSVAMEQCRAQGEGAYIQDGAGQYAGNASEGWKDGAMTVIDAISNALTFLEALGYKEGGDIHDDLALALAKIRRSKIGEELL